MSATLRIDLSEVLAETGRSVDLDDEVPLDSLTIGDTVAVFEDRPRVRASISNAGEGLVLLGEVQAEARMECSRCLEPFTTSLTGSLEGTLTVPEERPAIGEDEEWYPIDPDGSADLLPAVIAALGIEIPYAPLHDEACLGICPTCGCDLNRDTCTCETPDPSDEGPFAALKGLIAEDEAE